MRVVIDRFEGKYAICEKSNGEFIKIETCKVPQEARESDVLVEKDGNLHVSVEETRIKKKEIKNKLNKLFVD